MAQKSILGPNWLRVQRAISQIQEKIKADPLSLAVLQGYDAVMAQLKIRCAFDINLALLLTHDVDISKLLICNGACVNMEICDEFSVVEVAACCPRLRALRTLMQCDCESRELSRALLLVCESGLVKPAMILLGAGAQLTYSNAIGHRALHIAAAHGLVRLVSYLARAIAKQKVEYADDLVAPGEQLHTEIATIDDLTKCRSTPVALATMGGFVEVVSLLIEAGASLNQISSDRHTVFELAEIGATNEHMDILALLRKARRV